MKKITAINLIEVTTEIRSSKRDFSEKVRSLLFVVCSFKKSLVIKSLVKKASCL
jgi:hypothetical protein